ncbi:hypothetical protein BpHYR1_017821 [Brachionus plicatilis]|uniref:Uncharacterized protein n=1 Tax=Brachionus plicatilis TaxID=10195 RepID=A0A3M7RMC2_BRAPC|nr:hypothetical protein BpHYR1_017821 [Brachionus plicatilis]
MDLPAPDKNCSQLHSPQPNKTRTIFMFASIYQILLHCLNSATPRGFYVYLNKFFLSTFTNKVKIKISRKPKNNLELTSINIRLIKGTRKSFLHEEEGKYVLVDAVITNDTIFKVPKKKATKFIKENNTDYKPNLEKTLIEISTQLFQLNQKVNQPVNQNNSDQIGVKSAQPETLISPHTQKDFANTLRKKLKEKFPDNLNKTIGFYQKKDDKLFLEIKAYLKKFVPSKSDFSTAWFNATNIKKLRKFKISINRLKY